MAHVTIWLSLYMITILCVIVVVVILFKKLYPCFLQFPGDRFQRQAQIGDKDLWSPSHFSFSLTKLDVKYNNCSFRALKNCLVVQLFKSANSVF